LLPSLLLVAPLWASPRTDYDLARPAALRACDVDHQRGREPSAQRCYRRLLATTADAALQAEAAWALGDLRRANEAFRQAVAADSRNPRTKLRWARLFLAAHQHAEAARLIEEVLAVDAQSPAAQLAAGRLNVDRFAPGAVAQLRELAAAHPDLVEAPLLLSRMLLEEGRGADARAAAQQARSVAQRLQLPVLEAQSLLAAADLVEGRDPRPQAARVLAQNPRHGEVYAGLAHVEVMRRRYREAGQWLGEAVRVQPDLWSAHEALGVNQLRLGDPVQARISLQRAYAGDPFSVTTVNTLRLLDSLGQFERLRIPAGDGAPELLLQLHRGEAAALRPYVEPLARQALRTLSQRYGWTPQAPVTIELYPDHDDFAVRTAGLPGIGLLGVAFGPLVAMDSPSGRRSGDFHWGSTLWHELAHVVTLSVTDHRVPRWLSEGLSVFEEWRTGPTPGVAVTPRALEAFVQGRFLPVAQLDEGFIRPAYEDQVQVSYQQAGLVCLYVEQRWGMPRLVALLRAHAGETGTAEAVPAALGVTPADFDAGFKAFMADRFADWLADPAAWRRSMTQAAQALQARDWDRATIAARDALARLPGHAQGDNAYLFLADARLGAGDAAGELDALLRWRDAGGWEPAGLRRLALRLEAAGRTPEALAARLAINLVDPLAAADHATLGEALLAAGKATEARREFEVLLALGPQDPAQAHYGLARAWQGLGDAAAARREVLRALDIAPLYRPAQRLLLELRGEPTS
jgi:tetratricopeptide (TPR) repeat protein